MTAIPPKPYIFDEAQHDTELARLQALECVFDAATQRCLSALRVAPGSRCLEVGAGAGSIARWLSKTVGASGHVTALDLNTRFLTQPLPENLEVLEADIRTAPLAPASFDLVHARFVLIHVPLWQEALAALFRALKPGGCILLEEPDFSAARAFSGPAELQAAFTNVHHAIETMFRARGMDYAFGARLPALFVEQGLQHVSFENDAAIVPGSSAHARMMSASTRQLADKYIATGHVSHSDIECYSEFATNPNCFAIYHATLRAMAEKPA